MDGYQWQRLEGDGYDVVEIAEQSEGETVGSILVSLERLDEFAAWVSTFQAARDAAPETEEC